MSHGSRRRCRAAPDGLPSALSNLARSRIELARRAASAVTHFRDFDNNVSASTAALQTMRRIAQPIVAAPWNAATVTKARSMAWMRCPVKEVARIRAAFGGTVNDVVLAMLSEGAARYLAHHGCTPPTGGRSESDAR